jgi:LPS-assembly lipoprotein
MKSKLLLVLILLATVIASGCGFTLRGSAQLPAALQTMALTSPDGNSDILRELRRSLVASDVTLLDSPQANAYVLVLGAEVSRERVLSVNSNARAGEYELSLSVPFQLRNGSTVVLGPENLTIEKVYLADPDSAVAKAEERELMETEMRRELVNLLLRRLQSVTL